MNPILKRAKARGVGPKTLIVLEQFEADVARDPNDAHAYATMGNWWHYEEQYAKALDQLNMAIHLDPRFAYALCARADLQSTCPDPVYRNGDSAVKDATDALNIAHQDGQLKQDWQHRMYLRVLATAHAEAGNFDTAIEIQKEALAFTITKSATREIKAHLSKYELREPIRDKHGVIGHGPGRKASLHRLPR